MNVMPLNRTVKWTPSWGKSFAPLLSLMTSSLYFYLPKSTLSGNLCPCTAPAYVFSSVVAVYQLGILRGQLLLLWLPLGWVVYLLWFSLAPSLRLKHGRLEYLYSDPTIGHFQSWLFLGWPRGATWRRRCYSSFFCFQLFWLMHVLQVGCNTMFKVCWRVHWCAMRLLCGAVGSSDLLGCFFGGLSFASVPSATVAWRSQVPFCARCCTCFTVDLCSLAL